MGLEKVGIYVEMVSTVEERNDQKKASLSKSQQEMKVSRIGSSEWRVEETEVVTSGKSKFLGKVCGIVINIPVNTELRSGPTGISGKRFVRSFRLISAPFYKILP